MNEEVLRKIIESYSAIELQLLEKIAKLIEEGNEEELDQTWVAKKLANIRRLKRDTAALLNQLAGLDDDVKQLLTEAFLTGAFSPNPTFLGTNGAALNNLVAELLGELRNARFQILRQTLDAYRNIIGQVTQSIAAGATTRIKVAKDALNRFAAEGITAFITKDGKKWGIAEYVSMATRTATNNSFREGRIQSIIASDGDLIIVSAVSNPRPSHKKWERKILSISGKDKRYPSLDEAKADMLFGPNCKHSFTKYIPGLTKVETEPQQDEYEATQEQRYYERQIRKYKRVLAADPTNTKAKEKIKAYQGKIRELVDEHDLVRNRNRESINQAL